MPWSTNKRAHCTGSVPIHILSKFKNEIGGGFTKIARTPLILAWAGWFISHCVSNWISTSVHVFRSKLSTKLVFSPQNRTLCSQNITGKLDIWSLTMTLSQVKDESMGNAGNSSSPMMAWIIWDQVFSDSWISGQEISLSSQISEFYFFDILWSFLIITCHQMIKNQLVIWFIFINVICNVS